MNRVLSLLCVIIVFTCLFSTTQAQYNPYKAFARLKSAYPVNEMRSANGAPGPDYWQNSADYLVDVTFDTTTKSISGRVTITYTNNSPDPLSNLWLQLVQNIDRVTASPENSEKESPGFHIHSVKLASGQPLTYLVDGTRMQIRLPEKMNGGGDKIKLTIAYHYILQQSSRGGRSGYMDTENGRLFEVSYWYPRMCVYDDLNGWNTLPFLGAGEFYLDYGDIDYSITLPEGMLVAGTGVLDNPTEVLTEKEIKQLEKARHSDKTVWVRDVQDLRQSATRTSGTGLLTWHFHMNNTRDVAWVASEAFLWDAARINLPDGKKALAMSLYPVESMGDSAYGRGTEYLKASVELFSKKWYPYPYQVAVNVGGKVGGMEFPGMAMDWWRAKNKSLFALISHEIGHSWYPMIVGSNERRHAWMDEGFNTFIDLLAQAEFNEGEYAPKRDGEYAPGGGNPANEIVPFITGKNIPPVMTPADAIPRKYLHPLAYFKTAFGLVLLRNVILGQERFDYAFRQYTEDWAFKHPSPADFFREMESKAGAELDWFWRGWFLNNWQLDQAVKSVKYVKGNPANGANITLVNLRKMPMPVMVQVIEADGAKHVFQFPVQVWETDSDFSFPVPTTHKIKQVIVDPKVLLPDVDRENNVWEESD